MTYRALARKYRSSHFGELIGQDVLVRTLSSAIEKNRLHHAYLFTGIRGTGKTFTARILAKAINYAGPDGLGKPTIGPTDDCPICKAIAADQCPDVIEIDAASNTGVDDVRQIIENARYSPMQARYKVFIIDEVHMLSKNAFNALLKTLEEPPAHVVFILATTEIRKVPTTILSRCQRFDLRRVDAPILVEHYKKISALENVSITEEALQIIARAADGSVRDGLSILDQAIAQANDTGIGAEDIRQMLGQGNRDGIATIVTALLNGQAATALEQLQELHHAGADPMAVLDDLLDGVHLITRSKIKPDVTDDATLSPRLREMAKTLALQISLSALSRVWQMLLKSQPEVAQAAQPIQALEMALIRICYAASLPPLDDLSKRGPPTHSSDAAPVSVLPVTQQPVTQMRVVSSNAVPQTQSPQPIQAVATDQVTQINDLRQLIVLCEEKNDPMLGADLYANIRLVRMQHGQMEFAITGGASKDLIGTLNKRLLEWTGQRWAIAVSTADSIQTLSEKDRQSDQVKIKAAYDDPAMAVWRKQFPQLTITKIMTE